MLIFFGTRTSTIGNVELKTDVCPKCNHEGLIGIFMKTYFHVFWIPILPLWGSQATVCPHCKATDEGRSITIPTRNRLNSLKSEIKTPKWMFTGLFAMGLLFGLPITLGAIGAFLAHDEKEYVQAPRVHDLYILYLANREDGGESNYFILQLQSVNAEKYQFRISKKQYAYPLDAKGDIDAGLYKQEEFYAPGFLTIERDNLLAMKETGDLDSIIRPDTAE
jgi:hypothetical protein